jgi:serine/threonine protein kinase
VTSCPVDDSPLRTTSDLAQGMIIGRKYEVVKKIGSGGMASVYLARHLAFDELRAIKVVRGWMAEDEGFLRRLRSEAVMLRRLQHPNAVRVDDIDNFDDGRPFVVMEYVQGTELHALIRDQGPFPISRVLRIASQMARALSAAHKLGIVHRDIKPDNVLVVREQDGSELVKILDFGIAKLRSPDAEDPNMTQTGLVLCTPGYASPEQARGLSSDRLDGRSDLYSLGLVMYEMLTGELPFHSDTPLGMLLAQISTPPRPPAELKPELKIPSAMSDLLMKLLEKDPDQRFQSAQELLDAIANIKVDEAAEQSATAAPDDATTSSAIALSSIRRRIDMASAPTEAQKEDSYSPQNLLLDLDEPRSKHQHRWLWALAAMLGLVAIGGTVYEKSHSVSANSVAVAHPTDGDILGGVKEKLFAIDGARNLRASVAKGVVSLAGDAPSQSTIDETARSVATVPGVVQVDRAEVRVVKPPQSAAPAKAVTMPSKPPPAVAKSSLPAAMAAPSGLSQASPGSKTSAAQAASRVRDLMNKAQGAMDNGEYDIAITNYGAVLTIDSGNTEARNGMRKAEHAKQYEEQLDSQK